MTIGVGSRVCYIEAGIGYSGTVLSPAAGGWLVHLDTYPGYPNGLNTEIPGSYLTEGNCITYYPGDCVIVGGLYRKVTSVVGSNVYVVTWTGFDWDTGGLYFDANSQPTKVICPVPSCTPNWQCESPRNGYEFDGCGNRRLNSACNPSVPIVTETPNTRSFANYNGSIFTELTQCTNINITSLNYIGIKVLLNVSNSNAIVNISATYTKDGVTQTQIISNDEYLYIGTSPIYFTTYSSPPLWNNGTYSITGITISNIRTW